MYLFKSTIILKLISQKIHVAFKPLAFSQMYISISENDKLINLNLLKWFGVMLMLGFKNEQDFKNKDIMQKQGNQLHTNINVSNIMR